MHGFSIIKNIKNKIYSIKRYLNKIINIRKLQKFKPIKESVQIDIKDINYKKNIIKKRNAGIDLIRIVSMLGIVYTHVLFNGKAIYKYNKYKSKIFDFYTFIFWHNNSFSLISGIVSSKSTKYSNLLYLWLCVVFYSVGIRYYYLKYKKDSRVNGELYQDYYPVINGRYWYFTSYFGMFIFLPVVNKGIQYLNRPEFKLLVMSILGIFVFWNNYFSILL